MDEPARVSGASHRNYRHDLRGLPTAIRMFGKKYGAEMVQDIYLDHLRADSDENRKREQESGLKPRLWSRLEDDFLYRKFLELSDGLLAAALQTRSIGEIRRRRKQLGLIRPRIIKRTKAEPRIQRVVLRLQRGQKIFGDIEVTGGNKDIDFGHFTYKGAPVNSLKPRNLERVWGHKSFGYAANFSGNHCFYFSNIFSYITLKFVRFSYRLEKGKWIPVQFTI